MRKYLSLLAGVALVLSAASCNKLFQSENVADLPTGEYRTVTIGALVSGATTRASGTDVISGEAKINCIDVWAFDGSILAAHETAATDYVEMTLRADKSYTLYAVANINDDLSSLTTPSAIQSTVTYLEDEGRSKFRMYGTGSLAVGSSSATVSVKRVVARVRLVSATCTNTALGTMNIKSMFLSNVVGNQNLAGTASASTWLNKQGRNSTTKTDYVSGTNAGAPDMTAKDSPTLPYALYCYPNSSTGTPNGWTTSYPAAGQHTMLVIAATFSTMGSTVYYYPIDINKAAGNIEANHTYDVTATISALGSVDEPNKEIETGGVTVTVKAADWEAGASVNKTI